MDHFLLPFAQGASPRGVATYLVQGRSVNLHTAVHARWLGKARPPGLQTATHATPVYVFIHIGLLARHSCLGIVAWAWMAAFSYIYMHASMPCMAREGGCMGTHHQLRHEGLITEPPPAAERVTGEELRRVAAWRVERVDA